MVFVDRFGQEFVEFGGGVTFVIGLSARKPSLASQRKKA
jgi:hypothetical protein